MSNWTEFNQVFLIASLTRIAITLVGLSIVYLGYKLFQLGYSETSGEFVGKWGPKHVTLKRVGPGVFFALFGAIVICAAVWRPISVERGAGPDTTRVVTDPAIRNAVPKVELAPSSDQESSDARSELKVTSTNPKPQKKSDTPEPLQPLKATR
jgi:hypothetical protein